MEIKANDQENMQEKPARKTGNQLQQIGLNMVMVGVIILLGFMTWQRFFSNSNLETAAAEPILAGDDNSGAGGPYSQEDLPINLSVMATPIQINYGITVRLTSTQSSHPDHG